MLCLKAETLGNDMFSSHGVIPPMSLGSSIRRYLKRGGGKESRPSSASLSGDGSPVCASLEEGKTLDVAREKGGKMHFYRCRLEKDVQNLQKELQEEINLHVALANAVAQTTVPLSGSPCRLPDKAQELLANIAVLEITVLKLEEELIALHFQLSQERNERRLTEYRLRHLLSPSPSPRAYCPALSIGLCTTPPRVSKHSGSRTSHSLASYLTSECCHSQSVPNSRPSDVCFAKESLEACTAAKQEKEFDIPPLWSDRLEESKKTSLLKDLFHYPNQLSEEMVRCMRDIFLHLGDLSTPASKFSSVESMPSPVSPHGHLSFSSMASFSDSSIIPSSIRSPLAEAKHSWEAMEASTFDPYKVPEKVNWTNIGRYSSAAEVSWMSVGEKQLKYAAEALKRFRLLVEQLAKVNVASLSSNEKLAFWINLYNALIMHAYLAYGVPKSDIKLFSLMQKAAYTVGGQSFSAADIEYIVLKMKPPAHRPQIALVLALHKFKIPDEQRKYSVDNPEPLVAFALCCGMYSSPAVRIFTANNVIEELHDSLRDYVRAYVGVSNKGKLLVPKLLHCYAKGVVEDSLLTDWICRFLSPEQAAIIRDCTSHRKQRLLGARSFAIIPFDSRFRYLFLLENGSSYGSTEHKLGCPSADENYHLELEEILPEQGLTGIEGCLMLQTVKWRVEKHHMSCTGCTQSRREAE